MAITMGCPMTTKSIYSTVRKKYINARSALALAFFSRVDVATAAATSATGTALATIVGYDPWTWVFGGVGAAIVYIKKEVTTRLDAITNGMISVMLAGLVSPGVSAYISTKFSVPLPNPYPVAFILSASWPWIVPTLMSIFKVGGK
jgi:hypothetical protein